MIDRNSAIILHVTQCSCRGKDRHRRSSGPLNNSSAPTLLSTHTFTVQYSAALLHHMTGCPTNLPPRRYQRLCRRIASREAVEGGSCVSRSLAQNEASGGGGEQGAWPSSAIATASSEVSHSCVGAESLPKGHPSCTQPSALSAVT